MGQDTIGNECLEMSPKTKIKSSEKEEKPVLDSCQQKHLLKRIVGPLAVSCIVYMAGVIQVYACNEWIQNRIKVSFFGNESLDTNSSACSNHSDPNYEKLTMVQKESSRWYMYNAIALKSASFTSFFIVLFTDVVGRKFLFLLASFGNFLYFLLSGFIMVFDMSFDYLIGANVIYGLTGVGLFAVSYSYIADVTAPGRERTFSTFLLGAAIPFGGVIGSLVSGYYIEATGFIYPTFTGTGLAFVGFLLSFLIPESLDKEHRIGKSDFIKSIYRPFSFYFGKEFKGVRSLFIMLFFAFVFADLAIVHRTVVETLYQLGMPFCWSASKIGWFATIVGLSGNVFGLIILKQCQRCVSDIKIALISACTTAAAFILEGLAYTDLMLYLVAVPSCMSLLMCSLIRGTMSSMAPKEYQGALSAGFTVFQTALSFIGSVLDNSIYTATVATFHGFIFLVFGGYCIVATLFLILYMYLKRNFKTIPDFESVQEVAITKQENLHD